MTIVDKAIWIIERNAERALTLTGIAQACGVSRSHLANAFGTATGMPVMQYWRARRLSEAATTLAAGAPDILAVALDAGYGSHEAFTRAFRDRFGETPEQVRQRGSVDGLGLVGPLDLGTAPRGHVDPPRLVGEDALRIVGLAEPCAFDRTVRIPAQWRRFMTEHYDAIPARLERMPVGLTQPPDDEGVFEYVCGAEVGAFGQTPAGLVRVEIPAREYAVFEHRGHVSALYDTYAAIWNEALPALGRRAADAPTIERHDDAFDPGTGEGGLTLWVALDA